MFRIPNLRRTTSLARKLTMMPVGASVLAAADLGPGAPADLRGGWDELETTTRNRGRSARRPPVPTNFNTGENR
jgi:hypothetical protein